MRYAKIREMDISNGSGVGVSLFVQGCHFHCKGCFNQETWDFGGGAEWTYEMKQKFIELAGKPYVKRISILGGEPLADENVLEIFSLVLDLKKTYPDKKIWLYTGYTLEEIVKIAKSRECEALHRLLLLMAIDYLVDGRFELDKQDLFNKEIIFAGSTNQRILDAQAIWQRIKENQ